MAHLAFGAYAFLKHQPLNSIGLINRPRLVQQGEMNHEIRRRSLEGMFLHPYSQTNDTPISAIADVVSGDPDESEFNT